MAPVKLTTMQLAAWSLVYVQGMGHAEAAATLRVDRSAIKFRLIRARRRYVAAGLTPPGRAGADRRPVQCGTLSGYWTGAGYEGRDN